MKIVHSGLGYAWQQLYYRISVGILLICCFSYQTTAQTNVPVEQTITYKIITEDSVLLGRNQAEVKQCVATMNKAADRIRSYYPERLRKNADTATAIRILSTIDSVFTETGFLFYTSDSIHFDFLTLAFREEFDPLMYLGVNRNRADYFRALRRSTCKLIDCDLYCFIYMGIAEMTSLPISEIELPQHNFIRWNFADGTHINWEAIDGIYKAADNQMSCYDNLESMNESSRKHFLRAWSRNEQLSYYYTLRATKFDYNARYLNPRQAKRDYETAMNLFQWRTYALNNYVWMFVVYPEFDAEFNFDKLMAYMDTAIKIEENLNFYDTKAGLYARVKDFKNAVLTEEKGLTVRYDPDNARKDAEKHLAWFKSNIDIRQGKAMPQ